MVLVEKLRRSTAIAAAAGLLLASMLPLLTSRSVGAYELLGDREIRMSTSQGGATGATYRVEFDLSTTGDLGGIVVTFCQGTPIINDPVCVKPAGFDIATTLANGDAGNVDVSGWTAAVSDETSDTSGTNTFTLSNATPVATTAGNTVSFEMTDVDNPTASNAAFYARIYTYESQAGAQGYTLADPADAEAPVDAGGIALSTADQITIQAKVQERITFCVYTREHTVAVEAGNNDTCIGLDVEADPVVLGDDNGVLDSNDAYINKEARFNITTNASNGATIRGKGDTLTSGLFTIDAIGDTAATSTAGSEQFGLCVYTDPLSVDNTGLVPQAPYTHANCAGTTHGLNGDNNATFAFDTAGFGSLYGETLATKSAGSFSVGRLVFVGNIDDTTEPGIYTTTLTFIATGNY